MDTRDVDFELAKQCWATANVVTGFAIAQLVAFALTAGSGAPAAGSAVTGLDREIQDRFPVAMTITAVAAVVYLALVWFCQAASRRIMSTLPQSAVTAASLRIFDLLRIAATTSAGLASLALMISIKFPAW